MSPDLSAEARQFLQQLRGSPLFLEVVRSIPRPSLAPYRRSKETPDDKQFSEFVYVSGQISQHAAITSYLLDQ